MRGQRVTLLVLLVTVVASLVTADRSLRRRARFRGNPGLSSDNNSTVQVLIILLLIILTIKYFQFVILTERATQPGQRCVPSGKTETKNEETEWWR